jgi:hypothetical protein
VLKLSIQDVLVAGADVNCKTNAGQVPVELLIAEDVKEESVLANCHDLVVDDFLNLLPKDTLDTLLFVRTGLYAPVLCARTRQALQFKIINENIFIARTIFCILQLA